MIQPLWRNLTLIASYDYQLKLIENEIKNLDDKIQLLEKNSQELALFYASIENEFLSIKKTINSLETNLLVIEEEERKKKKDAEHLSIPKEYKALKKELQLLEVQHQHYEDQLIISWREKEKIEKKKEEQHGQWLKKQTELSELKDSYNLDKTSFNNKKNALFQKRAEIIETIPDKWRAKYEIMKNKVSDPVVPLIENSCSSCFYPILHHEKLALKNDHLMHCHSCYRILYYSADSLPTETPSK